MNAQNKKFFGALALGAVGWCIWRQMQAQQTAAQAAAVTAAVVNANTPVTGTTGGTVPAAGLLATVNNSDIRSWLPPGL